MSAISDVDVTDVSKSVDGESITALSLFDDDISMLHMQEVDFFSTVGTLSSAFQGYVQIPHQTYAQGSSIAATFDRRPLNVASESEGEYTQDLSV